MDSYSSIQKVNAAFGAAMKIGFMFLALCAVLVDASGGQDKVRLPSKVFENVNVMRETDFKDNAQYINVEEDVRQYILMELDRIETAGQDYTGLELYYLGFLFNEVDKASEAIDCLDRFLKDENSGADKDTLIKARSLLAEACLKSGEFDRAKLLLARLEAEKAPFLDLMFFDLARGYSGKGDEKQALLFARKALNTMNPELAGFFLEPLIASFLSNDMPNAATSLINDVDSDDPQTKAYLSTRKRQIQMINKAFPELDVDAFEWVLDRKPPTSDPVRSGKVVLLFFWAAWCDPGCYILNTLNRICDKIPAKDIVIICSVGLYGKTINEAGQEESLSREQEIEKVRNLVEEHGIQYPVFFDPTNAVGRQAFLSELPHFLLIDKKGVLRCFQSAGGMDLKLLEATARRLADEAGE